MSSVESNSKAMENEVRTARSRWQDASTQAAQLTKSLFGDGDGYGDRDARIAAERRVDSVKIEAERLFREYDDLSRQLTDSKMYDLQQSLARATWATFAVAVAVGVATVVQTIFLLIM
jgi:hypothetical protein